MISSSCAYKPIYVKAFQVASAGELSKPHYKTHFPTHELCFKVPIYFTNRAFENRLYPLVNIRCEQLWCTLPASSRNLTIRVSLSSRHNLGPRLTPKDPREGSALYSLALGYETPHLALAPRVRLRDRPQVLLPADIPTSRHVYFWLGLSFRAQYVNGSQALLVYLLVSEERDPASYKCFSRLRI